MLSATLHLRLWWENAQGQVVFGPGRALLLAKVEEVGSLHKAAKELGMSYRAAWGKIKVSEEALGEKLLIKEKGSKKLQLTPFALKLLTEYEHWRKDVYNYAQKQAHFWELK